ncbi:glycosyltransferase [Falsiroseomonas selenitidurans]|uniref:Glycosyltransferase family 4 protein n=1 Tax=Falsiroseomonas selenitidurans TaxID=2716335 RepID=A0ABX1ED04_9PROT|nr:glycosyltransferase [Falsiroseomonas selenitidurans]NKC32770.1 glycosyltransferase family 4 protein [Falsiroseomonas selenitidurans]
MPTTATLYYAPDGFDTGRAKLMGRHAAGEGMLGGLVRHAGFDRMVALCGSEADAAAFRAQVAGFDPAMPAETLGAAELPRLAETGCLMLPGPDLSGFAWRRRRESRQAAFSLTGITHTIASASAMDAIAGLLVAPVQPWDALVCTSSAVQGAVRRLFQGEAHYLARRLGASRIEGPALPVIPLGVDTTALAPDPAARAEWRARLRVSAQDILVLHHGRLSFHAKGHPLPMFLGLARAAAAAPAGARVVLLLSGWFADAHQRRAFTEMAKALAPGLAIRLVERPETGTTLRAAADLFTLLSDNVQESFGLAPVEALAAGLPVVGTDWDGLRDTVRHGVTGFRVPTLLAGPMDDLAARHDTGMDSYDSYIGGIAQFTAVDVGAAEAAFAALIGDAGLRARMAAAARADALARYDWAVVVRQYHALWAEQATLRRAGRGERAAPLRGEEPMPRRPDPGRLFADYPSGRLAPETRLVLAPGLADAAAALARVQALLAVTGIAARRELLPSTESFQMLLEGLEAGPATAGALLAGTPPGRAPRLHRALAWLVKVDVLRQARDAA